MIQFAKQLARQAGRICLDRQSGLGADSLAFKSPKDIVTAVDRDVEKFLKTEIESAYPDHDFLGEETGQTRGCGAYRWIIDPIDGTTSYVHGQPFYAVSIGLEHQNQIILGVVYAPALDQLFYGEKSKGAFLNEAPIHVSRTRDTEQAVLATGFACLRAGLTENNLERFNRIVPRIRDIRRYGSAAMDLCYTAMDALDGFWEMNLNLYDIAAGVLILREAGGVVTDFNGRNQFPEEGIAAGNPYIHPELIRLLNG